MRTYAKLTLSFFLLMAFAVTINAQQEQYGQASYYSDAYHGKKTASGAKYDKTKMTCAHNDYPYGSMLKVTHLENKKSVTVKVTDRGPYIKGRIVDLSRAAAQRIGLINDGVAQVKVELVNSKSGQSNAVASKPDKTPEEYSTAASTRRAVEETIKKSSARATNSTSAKPKPTVAAATEKKKPATKVEAKAELTAKGDAAPAALPLFTAKDLRSGDADLYQIKLNKPKKEGFGVQVASFSDYENVLKKVADLQGKWFDSIFISTDNSSGENVYKIILGQFETQNQANQYKKDLKKKKKISGFVVPMGDSE